MEKPLPLIECELMRFTSKHPQTDGSSEVTDATAEVALPHWLTTLNQPNNWPSVLSRLRAALNHSTKYSSTNISSNQFLFGFWTRRRRNRRQRSLPTNGFSDGGSFEACTSGTVKLVAMEQYEPARIDAKDAIAFAAMCMKYYYDQTHTPRFF